MGHHHQRLLGDWLLRLLWLVHLLILTFKPSLSHSLSLNLSTILSLMRKRNVSSYSSR